MKYLMKLFSTAIGVVMVLSLCACAERASNPTTESVLNPSSSVTVPSQTTTTGTATTMQPSGTQNCEHVWGMWTQKVAATCSLNGEQVRKCLSCGQEQSEFVPKLAHKESDWLVDQAAQVGIPGKKHTQCVHCGEKMRTQEIPALQESHTHSGKSWVTVRYPDCLNPGSRELRCDCGLAMQTEEVKPTGHSEAQLPAVAPTCTAGGLTEGAYCQVCKAVTVPQTSIEELGHQMTHSVIKPTETADGYTLHSCSRCTYSYQDNYTQFVPPSAFKYSSLGDGTCALIGLYDTTMTEYLIPEKSHDGETVVAIGEKVFFKHAMVQSISIPNTVKEVGQWAFAQCPELKQIKGSEYLQRIAGGAFQENEALEVLDLSGATELGSYLCMGDTSLREVKLCDDLTELPQGAFGGCTALKTITLPSKLQTIKISAFQNTAIENITLPDSVTELQMYAFRYCRQLKTIQFSDSLQQIGNGAFEQCYALEEAVLPATLQKLGRFAFSSCESLKTVAFHSATTQIGDTCFNYCDALETVTLPSNMTYIPDSLFSGCSALRTVNIPDTVESIGQWAFSGTALETVTIGDRCTGIGHGAFYGCAALKTVTIGTGLKKLNNNAFSGCVLIEQIILPNTFQTMGDGVFQNCLALKEVYLGTEITDIGSAAFGGCKALTSMFLPQSLLGITSEEYDSSPFTNCSGTLLIYTDAQSGNRVWERYFGRVSYGVSYEEYLDLIA